MRIDPSLDHSNPPTATEPSPFDGIICFGGVDWWYHNRGHYDLQIMRELSQRVPVLYVNSIGIRTPSLREGTLFAKRIARKLGSLSKGLTEVRPGFFVFSPVALPGSGTESSLVSMGLAQQVKWAARRCGIRRPLLWVACTPAVNIVDRIDSVATVYQRTDRYEEFHGVDHDRIAAFDKRLKKRADLVVFCGHELYNSERMRCRRAALVEHGVDFEQFSSAGSRFERNGDQPEDIAHIPHPRVGFIGGIDPHTFDSGLFVEVARRLPDFAFVMVGGCSLPDGWCPLPNVHFVGQRPYEQVPSYMAACDVLIMPWNQNDWIRGCNPIKLKEYLATGKPVVSTPFPELEYYSEHVQVAHSADDFAALIKRSIELPVNPDVQRNRVQVHGWPAKGNQAWALLQS